jgi:phosphoadenosine phosphosulfate reductase
VSDPHPARHAEREDKRSFLQKLAEFIHPGPDSADELIETLAEAEDNQIINTESRLMLEGVIRDGLAGDLAVVSSFGAESAVLLHLVASVDPNVPVLFLDTGKHFAETLAYRDTLVERLGLNLVVLTPDPDDLAKKDETGLRWSYDPDGCCEIRKVRPLEKAMAGFDASFTGRKSFQSSTRANLPRFEVDTSDAQGRLKINPLIDWDASQIEGYFIQHDLPRHPLIAQGYPSIG